MDEDFVAWAKDHAQDFPCQPLHAGIGGAQSAFTDRLLRQQEPGVAERWYQVKSEWAHRSATRRSHLQQHAERARSHSQQEKKDANAHAMPLRVVASSTLRESSVL